METPEPEDEDNMRHFGADLCGCCRHLQPSGRWTCEGCGSNCLTPADTPPPTACKYTLLAFNKRV